MKQSSTIISVIVAVVGLLAAFAIGLYIKKVRSENKAAESKAVVEHQTKQAEILTRPPREKQRSSRNLSPEQRAQLTEQIEDIRQRWATMSEPERKEFRAKMAEILQAGRSERNRRLETSPPEGRDKFAEEFMEMKNKWEDMSEEERNEFMEKIRESSNAIRQGND
jgi:regulatory protein YycI of two-component signal transduction system YycFG